MKFKRYERYKDSGVEWIGEIPKHWELKKIKYICDITMGQSPKSGEYSLDETGLPFLQGNAEFTNLYPIPKLYCNTANKFSKVNDILLSVRAPVGAMNISDRVYGIGRGLCAITTKKVQMRYLWYSMNVSLKELFIKSKGSTFEAVTVTDVNNLLSTLPPEKEQIAIANFLDQKTAEIDDLIADKEKLIELLQEKRQAIITEAVTKGLNPNVRMKDSGVEWIGKIPEHWSTKKGRYFLTIHGGYAPDSVIEIQNGIDYYKVEDLNQLGRQLFLEGAERKIDKNEHLKPVKPPVILIPKRGAAIFTNKVRISNNVCLFDSNVMGIRTGGKADVKYIAYSLLSRRLDDIADVSSIPQINNKHINLICFPFPPIEEQVAIAKYLDQKTNEIDNLIYVVGEQIRKIKEYRQSLIYEAVTGKIDVRNYNVSN